MSKDEKNKNEKKTPEHFKAELRARLQGEGVPEEIIEQVVESGERLGAFDVDENGEPMGNVGVTQLPAEIVDDPIKAVVIGLGIITRAATAFKTPEEFISAVTSGARNAITMCEATPMIMSAICAGIAVGTCLSADFDQIKEHELTPQRFIHTAEMMFGDEDGFYEMVDRMQAEQESRDLAAQFAMDCDVEIPEEER